MNEEIKMNRNSVHLDYPLTHPGVERAEQVVANFKRLSDSFSPTHTLAAMLLAAIVAAFVVVADQMMATWADGHLFAAWVALWAVAFAAVGLFGGVSKTMAIQMKQGLEAWSARMAQSRSDERLWAIAQTDARLMSDLQTAMNRSDEQELFGENSTQRRVARMLQNRQYYI
jgi:CBS domain containing-hemolysin-like protein